MKTPFLGGTYQSRSRNLAYSRCINLYAEILETKEGKEIAAFFGTDGSRFLVSAGSGPIRGLGVLGSFLYAVSGTEIIKVDANWIATSLGSPFSTTSGPVSIISNTTLTGAPYQIMFSDGFVGVTYDGTTLATVASFPAGGQILTYQDGFGVTNIPETSQFFQSNLFNFSTWNALNVGYAVAQPDHIVSMIDIHRELWILKENNIEIWINAGLSTLVFQRLDGVNPEYGCAAAYSPAIVGDSIMWLGQNSEGPGIVYQTKGYSVIRKSTHAIEEAWQSYSVMSDAIGYSYQNQGHLFYVLTFPSGNATWVYDATTGLWHERAFLDSNGQFHRHRSNCYAFFNNTNIVGDYQNPYLYALDPNNYTDFFSGAAVRKKWVRSWRAFPPGEQSYEDVTFDSLRIDMQRGISIPDGTDPTMILRWSNDSGHNWSDEMIAHVGKIGETAGVVNFRRLGSTSQTKGRDRVFEISGSDPIPVCLIAADMDATKA